MKTSSTRSRVALQRMPRFSRRSVVLVVLTLLAATRAPADIDSWARGLSRVVSNGERALRLDAPVKRRVGSPVPPGWVAPPLGSL